MKTKLSHPGSPEVPSVFENAQFVNTLAGLVMSFQNIENVLPYIWSPMEKGVPRTYELVRLVCQPLPPTLKTTTEIGEVEGLLAHHLTNRT